MVRSYSLAQQPDAQPVDSVTVDNQVSVGNTSTTILAANASRRFLWITNTGTNDIYINFGAAATTSKHLIKASGGTVLFDQTVPTQAVYGITASGSSDVCVSSA